jgi:hypothetical protein
MMRSHGFLFVADHSFLDHSTYLMMRRYTLPPAFVLLTYNPASSVSVFIQVTVFAGFFHLLQDLHGSLQRKCF